MSNDAVPTPEEKEVLKVLDDQKKVPMMKVQSTKPIKLKDKPGRGGVQFNLKRDFGFVPEEIMIQKVAGQNNTIVVSAIVPQKVLLKEKEKANEQKV